MMTEESSSSRKLQRSAETQSYKTSYVKYHKVSTLPQDQGANSEIHSDVSGNGYHLGQADGDVELTGREPTYVDNDGMEEVSNPLISMEESNTGSQAMDVSIGNHGNGGVLSKRMGKLFTSDRGRSSSYSNEETLKSVHPPPSSNSLAEDFIRSISLVLCSSYWNLILLCGPLALLIHARSGNQLDGEHHGNSNGIVFVLAGLTLVPLAERLSFITECIADQTNETFGALINATFGNAPELLISLSAMNSGKYRMIQLTLLGSMLCNMMFVFGASCLVGGLRWKKQYLKKSINASGNVNIGLLMLATAGFSIPSFLELSERVDHSPQTNDQAIDRNQTSAIYADNEAIDFDNVTFSRIVATVLLLSYIGFILLTLCTHHDEYDDENDNVVNNFEETSISCKPYPQDNHKRRRRNVSSNYEAEDSPMYKWYTESFGKRIDINEDIIWELQDTNNFDSPVLRAGFVDQKFVDLPLPNKYFDQEASEYFSKPASPKKIFRRRQELKIPESLQLPPKASVKAKTSDGEALDDNESICNENDTEIPVKIAGAWLFATTLFVNLISDVLVNTIEDFAKEYTVNAVFLASVILPLLSNIAEMVSAIIFAFKNKMDLCLGVTIGSTIQIALFVLPVSILYGWLRQKPMRIFSQTYESACLLAGVMTISFVLQGGSTNWFVGIFLLSMYIIIATGFAYHHIDDLTGV